MSAILTMSLSLDSSSLHGDTPLPKVLLGSARTGRVRHISKPSEQGQLTHLDMEVEFFKTWESPFEKPVTDEKQL